MSRFGTAKNIELLYCIAEDIEDVEDTCLLEVEPRTQMAPGRRRIEVLCT
jgi:hypothetical protein